MTDQLSELVGQKLLAREWKVATAESCTGGGVAAAITSIAGSSAWFEYGIVSYANSAKEKLLHVNSQTLADHGAVSEIVVAEMVAGVLKISNANIALAVSGIAGPSGGTIEKPVGTVCFGWGLATSEIHTQTLYFSGDRNNVQRQAVEAALKGLLDFLD